MRKRKRTQAVDIDSIHYQPEEVEPPEPVVSEVDKSLPAPPSRVHEPDYVSAVVRSIDDRVLDKIFARLDRSDLSRKPVSTWAQAWTAVGVWIFGSIVAFYILLYAPAVIR